MSRLAQEYLQSKFTLQRKVGQRGAGPVEWLSVERDLSSDHTFVRVNSRVLLLSRDAKS
jgi:hypothetical protein